MRGPRSRAGCRRRACRHPRRVVEVEARAVRRCDAEPRISGWQQWWLARIAIASRSRICATSCGCTPSTLKLTMPGTAVGRRPVERQAGDLAELLERVAREGVLVLLDRVEPDRLEVVDRGAEPDRLRHRRGAGFELGGQLAPGRRLRGAPCGSCDRPSGTAPSRAGARCGPRGSRSRSGRTSCARRRRRSRSRASGRRSHGAVPPAPRRTRGSRPARAPRRRSASRR